MMDSAVKDERGVSVIEQLSQLSGFPKEFVMGELFSGVDDIEKMDLEEIRKVLLKYIDSQMLG